MDTLTNNPLVSIIVRTKDRPKLLKNAINSIAAQTYRPIEVVLVNDGGCALDIKEIKAILGDVFLNYIRLEENTGRAHAGNIGIENAIGKYIGFLDDDDELYLEHVSILVDFLIHNDYRVAYTDSEIVKYDYDTEKDRFDVKDRYVLFSEDFSYEKLLVGNYIPLMCLLFDAKFLHDLKFDEKFDLYEDWDMLIQIAEKVPFHHIEKVTAKYNQNLGQQITADGKFHRNAFTQLMEKHIDKITPQVLFYSWQMIIDGREFAKGLEEPKLMIKSLKRLIEAKDSIISQMHKEIIDLQTNIKNIQNTLGWQMLESFRKFRDRLLPFGSKRRYYYDLIIKSIKVLKTQGIQVFHYKVRRKLKGDKRIHINRIQKSDICIQSPLIKESVDIIIPVYNAYEDVQECIKSVLTNTDMNLHRLVIIDDKSTDQRIKSYLEALKEEVKGINAVFLFNEENLGFAKTANRGMMFSDRDVILLNTDTIVTKEWVENLRIAAYSGPRIATVTPFSNNATICSIPNFCENNPLPKPFDLNSFAEFIERISLRYYPTIPTGVGFCMYIKQKILNEIGYFDELGFDKGYGEENDFSMRAIKKGYVHILDDATFIYHRGGSSFTPDVKTVKEQEALNILYRLHPEYLPIVNKFIRENPLREIHNYIKFRIDLENKKKDIANRYQTVYR
jgi:GT2 family glycosyltransferase